METQKEPETKESIVCDSAASREPTRPTLENEHLETDSASPEVPQLPPELLLHIIEIVAKLSNDELYPDRSSWRKTLLTIPRVSRTCHAFAMPFILQEVKISVGFFARFRRDFPEVARKLRYFVEDGLQIDKFGSVQKLTLHVSSDTPCHVFDILSDLVTKAGSSLRTLDVMVGQIPPDDFWKAFGELPRLRYLTVSTTAVCSTNKDGEVTDRYDARAAPYRGLLEIAERCTALEQFDLDTYEPYLDGPLEEPEVDTWAQTLNEFPELATKVHNLCIVNDEIGEWAECKLPNLNKVTLLKEDGNYQAWTSIDVFPALHWLELYYMPTCDLVNFPLRNLKKVHLIYADLDLQERAYPVVKNKFAQQSGIELKIGAFSDTIDNSEMEAAWNREAKFWKSIGVEIQGTNDASWPGDLDSSSSEEEEDDDDDSDSDLDLDSDEDEDEDSD